MSPKGTAAYIDSADGYLMKAIMLNSSNYSFWLSTIIHSIVAQSTSELKRVMGFSTSQTIKLYVT